MCHGLGLAAKQPYFLAQEIRYQEIRAVDRHAQRCGCGLCMEDERPEDMESVKVPPASEGRSPEKTS